MLGIREGKKTPSTPPPKKLGPSWVHLGAFYRLHETFNFKTICHHFLLGLMARAQTMGHNENMGDKLGTWWEHDENKLGIRENEKKPFPPLPQPKRKKNQSTLSTCRS